MGVILDTSALIGLHEAHPEVRTFLTGELERWDDGTVPKVHAVTLGELWVGVLRAEQTRAASRARQVTLETALSLDIDSIRDQDAETFGAITLATGRTMSHNDRWICAAAIRTRAALITQDERMAQGLNEYLRSLDLLAAVLLDARVVYVPRDPAQLAQVGTTTFVRDVQITEETVARLAQLDPREAEVLRIRFGLDRGSPRTLDETAQHFGLRPERVAQIETRAIANLRQTDKPD